MEFNKSQRIKSPSIIGDESTAFRIRTPSHPTCQISSDTRCLTVHAEWLFKKKQRSIGIEHSILETLIHPHKKLFSYHYTDTSCRIIPRKATAFKVASFSPVWLDDDGRLLRTDGWWGRLLTFHIFAPWHTFCISKYTCIVEFWPMEVLWNN